MSALLTFTCDACSNDAVSPYGGQLPPGWKSHFHQSDTATSHACSPACMVKLLRRDLAALEAQAAADPQPPAGNARKDGAP